MNFLYISPEFPPNFKNFVLRLSEAGFDVYAIGEADFYDMPEDLRSAIRYYVKTDLHRFDRVQNALDHMMDCNPKLKAESFHVVESHNEEWLRLESFINQKYNLKAIRPMEIDLWKKKSLMKKHFKRNDFEVVDGMLVTDIDTTLKDASILGYPLILKPDEGVGANGIYKVSSRKELISVFPYLDRNYFMEQFIDGTMHTYDGLADEHGNIVFESSLSYADGIMEFMKGKDPAFFVNNTVPAELSELGRKTVEVFNIRRKFFHFEFFYTRGKYFPLEVNCRPPGGPILDMMNVSAEIDLYREYAEMMANRPTNIGQARRRNYCGYVGRRDRKYVLSHDEIVRKYPENIVWAEENPYLYWSAMGRYKYIFKAPDKTRLMAITKDILRFST